MLDIKFIRENIDLVRQAVASRQDIAPLDEILKLDLVHRQKVLEMERLRHARKEVARERRTEKENTEEVQLPTLDLNKMVPMPQEKGRELRVRVSTLVAEVKSLEKQLVELLLQVPNIPQPSVPMGKDEADNVLLRSWREPPSFDFTLAPHWKLGESLGIIDFERGVKLSGTRFYVLKGLGARLQRALISFMLDLHTTKHGYQEVYPPFMVKRESMIGSSNLPKFADNLYHDEEDDFWFVPTAEVPLTNLHRDEIIPPGILPIYYAAGTACFRREKMSAGKDTRGIKRGHQFDKVELYKFTEPSTSDQELEILLNDAEQVCQKLGLPYRIKQLCAADLGFASTKSYDIEIWAAGCGEWLEVSTCSNCGDFQARRAGVRYRPYPGAKPRFVHTLNGSGLALPRVLIAIMENYQQADGSITIPEALQTYVGQKKIE